jgi:hypothetical protein
MAIAHGFRHAIHLDFNGAAEAFALVRSHLSISLLGGEPLKLAFTRFSHLVAAN